MSNKLDVFKELYPEKFADTNKIFSHIHRGNKIFIGIAAGEPRHLVQSLAKYLKNNPKAFFDVEVIHVWTLDTDVADKYKNNFRIDSFFIGDANRDMINQGESDYTPVFLSKLPDLFERKIVPLNMVLIQTSLPDEHGFFSLGVSVDIVKAAVENADLIVAQVNSYMPYVHGDGFIHIDDIDFIFPYDEPLLEYDPQEDSEVAEQIGKYVARIVQDGDTIQVGYGSIPHAILSQLNGKRNLGVHSELLTDGIIELMRKGVVDNSKKTLNRGKTIASYCMGKKETYQYINNNPTVELRRIDYTNNPMIIAQHDNMTAINTALEIDLTGQATGESIGGVSYSGIGGFANFMRSADLAKRGKAILAMKSTARNGEVSKIVPFLKEGTGFSLHRGDVQYVVTEYGIVYLQGKNIRERAMDLISIAHPKFRPWLIEEARKRNLIYNDQKIIPGARGEYREEFETYKTTKASLEILLRAVKISDEPLLKDFFASLSDKSLYFRFFRLLDNVPHEQLQKMVLVDNTKGVTILATVPHEELERVVAVGQCSLYEDGYSAEVAFATREEYQNKGITSELLAYLTYLAERAGILSFNASVLLENKAMIRVFNKFGFKMEAIEDGIAEFKKIF